jgi:hypothetical protein
MLPIVAHYCAAEWLGELLEDRPGFYRPPPRVQGLFIRRSSYLQDGLNIIFLRVLLDICHIQALIGTPSTDDA